MALNNIKRHGVKAGATRTLVLNMISADAELEIEHLGQSNFAFINDAMRGAGSDEVKAIIGRGEITQSQREKNRLANRETVAKHAVRAVRGFYFDHPTLRDADGDPVPDTENPVPSTKEGILQVVHALPDDIFDLVLAFALNQEHFRKQAPSAIEETAKK
jgi:hypothetical protein